MTAHAPQQRRLPLTVDNITELLKLSTVADCLRLTGDDVLELVADHELGRVFNLGSKAAQRRELRIWRVSFQEYVKEGVSARQPLDEIIAAILPALCSRPAELVTIRGTNLQLRWSCSQELLRNLIVEDELRTANVPGPKESPAITYTSAAAFLKRRAL
ncbi:MAG TPA: hypothetical protein VHB20_14535 [Verrucomicrobiae bacterium]|jgi:hypothetical protein|nr:hypothetical protein [Verrucomicrobiae bacterium]